VSLLYRAGYTLGSTTHFELEILFHPRDVVHSRSVTTGHRNFLLNDVALYCMVGVTWSVSAATRATTISIKSTTAGAPEHRLLCCGAAEILRRRRRTSINAAGRRRRADGRRSGPVSADRPAVHTDRCRRRSLNGHAPQPIKLSVAATTGSGRKSDHVDPTRLLLPTRRSAITHRPSGSRRINCRPS